MAQLRRTSPLGTGAEGQWETAEPPVLRLGNPACPLRQLFSRGKMKLLNSQLLAKRDEMFPS